MIQRFKKPIAYLLATLMIMPAYLWVSFASAPLAHAAIADIIIDDGDAGFSLSEPGTAVWDHLDDGSGYLGDYYTEDNTTTNKSATWRPTISTSGTYEVFAHWSASQDRPSNVTYAITYDGGSSNVLVNQKKKADGITIPTGNEPSGWRSLGSYNFAIGTSGFVRVVEKSSGNTCVDAIKFVKANTPPTVPSLQTPSSTTIEATGSDILLTWMGSIDVEGDALQYEVEYDGVSLGLTTDHYKSVTEALGLHTWKVRAFDGIDYSPWSVERSFTVQDTTAPTIILVGDNPYTLEAGTIYSEPGFVASDHFTGDLTGSVLATHSVNSSVLGSYTVTYSVTDDGGNNTTVYRTVDVVDTTGPVIDSYGSSPNTTGEISTITVTAHDITGIASAMIDINAGYVPMIGSGPYTYPVFVPADSTTPINYNILLTDTQGNARGITSAIIPQDNDKPVIISVSGTSGTTGGSTLVTVNATDNITPTHAEIMVGIGSWVPMTGSASPFTYNVPIPLDSTSAIPYSVRVYDAAGNSSISGPYTILVTDSVAPVGTVVINSDDVYTHNANVSLNINATDNIGVTEMCVSNMASCGGAWQPYVAGILPWTLDGADGTKTVYVWYKDAAGIESVVAASDSIILDTTAPTDPGVPTPNVSNPTNVINHIWTWAASSDLLSGLKGYWLKATGSFFQDWTWWGLDTDAQSSNFFEGIYNIFIKAEDNAGNQSGESSYTLIVDTTPPTSVLNPTPVNPTKNNNISYTGVATDPSNTTIAGVEYRIDGGSWNAVHPADAAFDSAIESINFTTGILSDGTHLIEVRAYDAAGNYQAEPYPSDTIKIDTAAPTTTSNVDGLWHNSTVTVTLTCNDGSGTGCASTYYSIDGLPYANYTDPFDVAAAGIHSLKYYSVDALNNNEAEQIGKEIKIDLIRPSSTISTAGVFGPNTWTGQISGTSIDPNGSFGSGVNRVHVEVTNPSSLIVFAGDAAVDASGNWSLGFLSSLFTMDGNYQVFSNAVDNAGNVQNDGAGTSTVEWDKTAPVITINPYTTDPTNQDITVTASTNEGTLNTTTHTFTANGSFDFVATDAAGNVTTETVTITNIDKDAPVITLIGSDETVEVYGAYIEQGANVTDNVDSGLIALVSGTVNTNIVGNYTIYYDATDSAGNAALQVTRTVHVVDTTPPVITLNGAADVTVEVHGTYTELGANVTDNYDADFAATVSGTVDANVVGIYTVYYDATDSNSNPAAQVTRTVHVVDTTAPEMPTATPKEGEYQTAQKVELSSTDNYSAADKIKIFYTLDGTDPADNKNASRVEFLAGGSVNVDKDLTLKAIAYDEADNPSPVLEAKYDIAPDIQDESHISATTNSVIITWKTDQYSTSRVVYDTVSHSGADLSGYPHDGTSNFGYAFSSALFDNKVKVRDHSVFITGLTPGTTYYFRAISSGSPETISKTEMSFATNDEPVVTTAEATTETVATPAADQPVAVTNTPEKSTTTPSDDQGQIKGDENTASTEEDGGVNWTPWIILFILLILAGAATGGYFYWFAGDDDDDDEKKEKVEDKPKPKAPVAQVKTTKKPAPKANAKKSKRW